MEVQTLAHSVGINMPIGKNGHTDYEKKYTYDEAFAAALAYFNGDKMCADVWCSKYALKDSDGNIYELTPRDMHRRIAKELARIEKKYPNPLSEDEIFELLDNFTYIIP